MKTLQITKFLFTEKEIQILSAAETILRKLYTEMDNLNINSVIAMKEAWGWEEIGEATELLFALAQDGCADVNDDEV